MPGRAHPLHHSVHQAMATSLTALSANAVSATATSTIVRCNTEKTLPAECTTCSVSRLFIGATLSGCPSRLFECRRRNDDVTQIVHARLNVQVETRATPAFLFAVDRNFVDSAGLVIDTERQFFTGRQPFDRD